jgi:hypothetical protein
MGMSTKIYLVENIEPGTNKVYIGKTKSSREYFHKKTFGQQISYTYIDKVDSLCYDDWEPLETYWIEQFKQWGFNVVNKRKKGGSGPEFQTEEIKQKISKILKNKPKSEQTVQRMSASKKGNKYNLGKTHTEEHNKKISEKLKGRIQSLEEKQKKSQSSKGKLKPEGFGETISKAKKGKSHKGKAIIEINSNTIYNSVKECAFILNIDPRCIIHVLRKRSNQTKQGYIFNYI